MKITFLHQTVTNKYLTYSCISLYKINDEDVHNVSKEYENQLPETFNGSKLSVEDCISSVYHDKFMRNVNECTDYLEWKLSVNMSKEEMLINLEESYNIKIEFVA